jgi:hypothetical protein
MIPDFAAISGISWAGKYGGPASSEDARAADRLLAAINLHPGRVVFSGLFRHRRLTLHQRVQPKSHVNGSAAKEIPGLTRRSGIADNRNPLFCLVLDPVINGNTTTAVDDNAAAEPCWSAARKRSLVKV